MTAAKTEHDVTVVIPTRERPELLRRCLESVLAQTTPPAAVVVVEDGGITDATRGVIASLDGAAVTVAHTASTGGAGQARNVGLATVATPLVAFLDDDDWWRPAFVERCVEAQRAAGPGIAVVTDTEIVTHRGTVPHRVRLGSAQDCLYRNAGFTGQNAVFPADAVRAIGGYDPALRSLQDRDLQLRLLRAGVGFVTVREYLTVVDHAHPGDRISVTDPRAVGAVQFYRKWAGSAPAPVRARMALRALTSQRHSSSRVRRAIGHAAAFSYRRYDGLRARARARRAHREEPGGRPPG